MMFFRLIVAGSLAAAAGPAAAALVGFTDESAFRAALTSSTLEDFNSAVPGDIETSRRFETLTIAGLYAGSRTNVEVAGAGRNLDVDNSVHIVVNIAPDRGILFSFDAPVTAWGAWFRDLNNRGQGTAASFGEMPGVPLPDGSELGLSFFGVTSSTPFTSVRLFDATDPDPINPSLDSIGIDNVVFGTAAATVPEPASWALMIAGFGTVGAAARRRRQAARGM